MMVYALSLVLLLAVVYYFKPSLFNFMNLTQGFEGPGCEEGDPDYPDCLNAGFADINNNGIPDDEESDD